jgi:hypothetical protein
MPVQVMDFARHWVHHTAREAGLQARTDSALIFALRALQAIDFAPHQEDAQ